MASTAIAADNFGEEVWVDSTNARKTVRARTAAVIASLAPRQAGPTPRADPALRTRAESLLGAGPVDWACEVAQQTSTAIVDAGFESLDAPILQIGEAAETALLVLLLRLAGHSASSGAVTRLQGEIVRHRISHGTPFHRIVQSQRLAQHRWADLLLSAAADRKATPDVLRNIVTVLDRYFDEGIDWHLTSYLAEQERFVHSEAAERARLIEALVAGRDIDAALVRRRLGADLAERHTALVVRDIAENPSDTESRIQHVVSEIRRVASCMVIAYQPGHDVAWLWLADRDEGVPEAVEALLRDDGVHLGAGGAHAGADGFRRSHLEACEAVRLATSHTPLVHHRNVALVALLGTDLERARWFVLDRLGALARADAKNAELRETLAAYYRAGTRLSVAAEALHVHRNTLLYRLRHITELLGHPVVEVMPEVQCALLLAAQFGDAVLDHGADGHAARTMSRPKSIRAS